MRKRSCRRGLCARWMLVPVVILCLLGLWSWYAGRPALLWYVSPPVDGSGARIHVLRPVGWSAQTYSYGDHRMVDFTPPDPAKPPNAALRLLLRCLGRPAPQGIPMDELSLKWGPVRRGSRQYLPFNGVVEGVTRHGINPSTPYIAEFRGGTLQNGTEWSLMYSKTDRLVFNATHSAICNSLGVE